MPKWITTEGIFAASGALWLIISSFTPIPASVPLGIPVPGFTEITITPGLLIGVALVPVLLKMVQPGKTPFVNSAAPEEGK